MFVIIGLIGLVLKNLHSEISKNCENCQVYQRLRFLEGPMRSTPIPPAPMVSVAIDLFKLPTVFSEGKKYDTLAVCVDRHSGWIVSVPCLNSGKTGAKLAK